MSHEVIRVIKLVKYNRKSHEMIRLTRKRIPTIVNKEIHKNKHSHEMTRFQNRIAVWSSMHESERISGSSHISIFELPVYRIYCDHKSESSVTGLDLTKWVRNVVPRNHTHTRKHKYTLTHMYVYSTDTCTQTYMYI